MFIFTPFKDMIDLWIVMIHDFLYPVKEYNI